MKRPPRVVEVPNPVAVATIEGILDAGEKRAIEIGVSENGAAAIRAIFGMLIGTACSSKPIEIELDDCEPVTIRPADARAVAMLSVSRLARLEAENAALERVKSSEEKRVRHLSVVREKRKA